MGDALGCAIVQQMCKEELEAMDREKEVLEMEGDGDALLKGDIEIGSSM